MVGCLTDSWHWPSTREWSPCCAPVHCRGQRRPGLESCLLEPEHHQQCTASNGAAPQRTCLSDKETSFSHRLAALTERFVFLPFCCACRPAKICDERSLEFYGVENPSISSWGYSDHQTLLGGLCVQIIMIYSSWLCDIVSYNMSVLPCRTMWYSWH